MKTLTFAHKNSAQLRQVVRAAMVLAVALGCVSCTCLNVRQVDGDFGGLKAALKRTESKGTLRLLLVHGMTHHEPGWSAELVSGITTRLHLVRDPAADSSTSYERQRHPMGTVRVAQFANSLATSKLRVYELTWSEITKPWKTNQFANDESRIHQSERVVVNRNLKTDLLNDGFADAVLYAGRFRQHMQYPIMRAVAQMLDDGLDPDDEVAIATTSLGSYMTLDTLARMSQGFRILNEAPFKTQQVHQLLDQTTQIFMLANQIPLLELSEVSNPLGRSALPETTATNSAPGLKGYLSERQNIRQAENNPKRNAPRWKLRIVAISDPNDLLTYPLTERDGANQGQLEVSVRNVRISVERYAILGVFAWPATAHSGHDRSSRVLDLMVNGHP